VGNFAAAGDWPGTVAAMVVCSKFACPRPDQKSQCGLVAITQSGIAKSRQYETAKTEVNSFDFLLSRFRPFALS
jgi:hypothetical protein